MKKRKDKKGRALKKGESYRSDGRYMYRYTDSAGVRRSVYAQTLDELREAEREIQSVAEAGANYNAGKCTVIELVERYLAQKHNVRYSTEVGYQTIIKNLKKYDFSQRTIINVKSSDCKMFFTELHKDGCGYNFINRFRSILKPAFETAVEDDILEKNPFRFRLSDIIPNESKHRQAINSEDKKNFLDFVRGSDTYRRYYEEIIILLGTGLRVSELCGLTLSDVDLENRQLFVRRQLKRKTNGEYYVEKPKTKSGERIIPLLDDNILRAFQNVIMRRRNPDQECVIDDCTNFLFLNKLGRPMTARNLEAAMKNIRNAYEAANGERLPEITPHVLRHTFCTELATAGMDIKSLQYLMGHADANTTMNVYAHTSFESSRDALSRIIEARKKDES